MRSKNSVVISKETKLNTTNSEQPKTSGHKLRIAIFDLADCEGCELELINLREKLALIAEQTNVVNWRFASNNKDTGPFDVTFIEGSPITESDIELAKQARKSSRLVVSLGSCADLGGIQTTLNKREWEKGIKEIYGKDYKTKSKSPKPLEYYIDVDVHLPGCPVNQNELSKFLSSLLSGKKPIECRHSVCLECKINENVCLLLDGEPCLGPVTKGGCEAACPSRGLRCWGCFGPLLGGNQQALKNIFDKKFGETETQEILKTFYSQTNEYKTLYPKDAEEK